ncbi:MAG: hypothetical protein IPG53_16515 [Ignavibacteriales bacterium]|nr:hypothetical protein [Ignavibacteriales bacterium]
MDERSARNLLNDSIDKVINDSLADSSLNPMIKKVIRLFKGTGNFKKAQIEMIRNRKRMMTWLNNFSGNPDSTTIYQHSLYKIEEFTAILFPTLELQISRLEELNNFILEQSDSPIAKRWVDYILKVIILRQVSSRNLLISPTLFNLSIQKSRDPAEKKAISSENVKISFAEVESEYRAINENLIFFPFTNEFDLNFENNLLVRSSEYSQLLCETYKLVADEFNKAKQRINCIDFEDMLILTADLLTKKLSEKM